MALAEASQLALNWVACTAEAAWMTGASSSELGFAHRDGDRLLVGAVLVRGVERHAVDAGRRGVGPEEGAVLVRRIERRRRRQVAGRQRHRVAIRRRGDHLELEGVADRDGLAADGVQQRRRRQAGPEQSLVCEPRPSKVSTA